MVLNDLGFVERRLYLFPEFFEDIAVERLLGDGITREQLNDDLLGRTLDAIAAYGPTELFNEIVAECLIGTEFGSQCIHVDTTNFSVTGNYEADFNTSEVQITYGYPKDGRWDLKRFVLGIAANQHGVPLFLQTFSGNESDKETLRTIIKALTENLKSSDKVYHVADSAFYSDENLRTLGTRTFWITLVPATIARAKEMSQAEVDLTPFSDPRYAYAEYSSTYAGIDQKWVLYHSSPMQERMEKTFDDKLKKDYEKAQTSWRKLGAREFACEPDARAAAERWVRDHPRYLLEHCEVVPVRRRAEGKRGRPKAGEVLKVAYTLSASIVINHEYIDQERKKWAGSSSHPMMPISRPTKCWPRTRVRERSNAGSGSSRINRSGSRRSI